MTGSDQAAGGGLASLAMYDRPEVAGANDRLWGLIRDRLHAQGWAAPDALTRGAGAYWQAWQSPDLILSQTCGYPYRAHLAGRVTLVGTPDYGLPGCPPGYYRSVFVARADDLRRDLAQFDRARFAYNDPLSQSGWAGPQVLARARGLRLIPAVETGAHVASARAVAGGAADLAALDAQTWRLIARHDPALAAQLHVVGQTDPAPGLPLITAPGRDPAPLFAAVTEAIAALAPADRTALDLCGLVAIPAQDYLALPSPPAPDRIMLEF